VQQLHSYIRRRHLRPIFSSARQNVRSLTTVVRHCQSRNTWPRLMIITFQSRFSAQWSTPLRYDRTQWNGVDGELTGIDWSSVMIKSRVPCTNILSQEIQFFQETSFCVLQVLLLDFTNTIWQLYIDFYNIRYVFEVLSNCVFLKLLI